MLGRVDLERLLRSSDLDLLANHHKTEELTRSDSSQQSIYNKGKTD